MKPVFRRGDRFATPLKLSAVAVAAILAACSSSDNTITPEYAATIRTTSYGVPHVLADNFKGAGFGYGYAFAQQNFCLYAEELVTLRGERAQYFGATGGYLGQLGTTSGNVDSDFYYKLLFNKAQADRIKSNSSQAARDIVTGFAAGYNRYLSDTGAANLPAECRSADWVKPMTEDEAYLRLTQASVAGSSLNFINSIGNAQPPATAVASLKSNRREKLPSARQLAASPMVAALQNLQDHTIGSNGFGLGREVTQSGKGIVMGNPHFPWWGALRLHQIHITVPNEKYDVMGATLLGVPLPLIGFNSTLGWTHTFSTDNRFTLRYLALDPSNPTRYIKDGASKPMTAVPLSISAKGADGKLTTVSRTLYTTEFGPMLMDKDFAWGRSSAFAIQDANYSNYQLIDQVILNGKATSVDGLLQAAATHTAMPWVNTMAADKNGDAMYLNYSVAAKVADAQLAACVPGRDVGAPFQDLMATTGLVVMAGTASACDWSGSIGAAQRPSIKRSDYIVNANDSHWWSTANTFLTGYPKIIATGPDAEGSVQNNRTRTGHAIVRDRLSGADGLPGNRFTVANLQQIYQKSRFFKAEKWLPGFTAECLASPTASAAAKDACAVLKDWDKTHAPMSVGAVLFLEFYAALGELEAPSWWSVAFNPADPLETPRGNAGTAAALTKLEALVATAQFDSFAKRRIRPADVQVVQRAEGNLSIPGGRYTFNNWRGQKVEIAPGTYVYTGDPKTNAGAYGNSYMQFVTWDDSGPVAEGILTYSQSTNPAHANFSDQTRKYSAGEWVKLPYTDAQIKADPNFKEVKISQ
ncbi:MAG TPA: penicillin acylase family protein [Burkholderiaceae bacterium]|nr:penicillin acylase family protein [Burkholderiaceae bacterium]HPL78369.1 penicillin acylase family protein [Burkholderiaceae bacterium]